MLPNSFRSRLRAFREMRGEPPDGGFIADLEFLENRDLDLSVRLGAMLGFNALMITIGTHPTGPRNSIADVDGVTVGHVTLDDGRAKTGVTAILPAPGNVFRSKLLCGAVVFNG
jgi:hypothetical protein